MWIVYFGIVLVVLFVCVAAKGGLPPLERDEMRRIRRLSDNVRREQILPFE